MTDATTLDEAIKNVRDYDNAIHMVTRSEEPRLAKQEALMIAALNAVVALGEADINDPMFDPNVSTAHACRSAMTVILSRKVRRYIQS